MKTHSNYEVFEEIGRGARTVVFAGYNQMTKRNVAIKEIADASDPDQLRSLQDTARFLAELPDYTNIIEVKDLIPENGWLVLDRMRESLADRLIREKRGVAPNLVRNILRQALKGLTVLHDAGRWVGNIRPANLLVNDDGQIKIGDSPGLVADGVVRPPDGRSKYLAPERIDSSFGEVGPWTDLYNLGFTALELLKGPKFDDLFTGTGAEAINPDVGWMRVHGSKVEKTPAASEVVRGLPADLSKVIDRMLQKEVSKRYQSAKAALADIDFEDEDAPLPSATGIEFVRPPALVAALKARPRPESAPAPKPVAEPPRVEASVAAEPKKKKPWMFIGIAGILGLALLAVAVAALTSDDSADAAQITIETTPEGAKITLLDVNKELKTLTPGPVVVGIKGKPRPIRLDLEGYEPFEMEIDPAKTIKYEATLKPKVEVPHPHDPKIETPPVPIPKVETPVPPTPKVEQVTIETNPGAKLTWLDAEGAVPLPTGSPVEVELKDKPRKAKLELQGYEPLEIEIDPAKAKKYKFDLKPIPKKPPEAIAVKIISQPETGCDITVDGKLEGKTPKTLMLIPGRTYRIGVSRPTGETEFRTFELRSSDREMVWNIEKEMVPKKEKEDPQLVADLKACDDAIRKGKSLAEYLKTEAPPKFAGWQKGSTAGSVAGSILVAHCLAEGIGTPRNEAAAVELYRKAVDHPTAAYWLGVMHEDGKGPLKNSVTEAAKLYRKAADGGYALAMYAVGRMRQTGRDGEKKDDATAAEWFRKAADAGHPAAAYNFALMTEIGLGVKRDEAAAVELYRKAIALDYPAAMNNLGLMLKLGKGTEKDEAQAVELFTKAADLGNREGINNLGVMQQQGRGGLKADEAKAIELYNKAAKLGNRDAMYNLGQLYSAKKAPAEMTTAIEWFTKASDLDHHGAMNSLGVIYLTGRGGVKVDEAKAVKLFKHAAEHGYPPAMYQLGVLTAAGKGGFTKDEMAALEWYHKSAEAGYDVAMYQLGLMYQMGTGGLMKDEAKAAGWFKKAAALGHKAARDKLGS